MLLNLSRQDKTRQTNYDFLKSTLFKCGFLLLFISFFLVLPIRAYAATYYVDQTGGNDGNLGTSTDQAWKTISQVNSSNFSAGDQILFKKGETWREQLTVPSSGTSGNPITFGAYGSSGAQPIITGPAALTGWTLSPTTQETSGIFASGFENETDAFTTDFNGKTTNGTNSVLTTTTSGEYHTGSKGMKVTFDGTNTQAYITKTFSNQTGTYVRVYFKLKTGFSFNSAYNSLDLLSLWDGTTRLLTLNLQAGDSTTVFATHLFRNYPTWADLYSGYPSSEIQAGSWYRAELYFKKGTGADGTYTYWLNGVQKYSASNLDLTGVNLNKIIISNTGISQTAAANSVLYVDDVKADTSPVGLYSQPLNSYYTSLSASPITVSEDSVVLTQASSLTDLNTGSGRWFWDSSTSRLYIRTSGDDDPVGHSVTYSSNSGVDFNSKNYIRITQLHVNGPITMSGSSGQVDYVVSEYNGGDTVTISGSSNALYNSTLNNNAHYPIKITGNSNIVKNNILYANYLSANTFIYIDSGVSTGPILDNNLYYGIPTNIKYGINGAFSIINNSQIDSRVTKMKRLGVNIARNDIRWSDIEGAEGVKNWSNPDYYINKLVDNGIEPLEVLMWSPEWANDNSDPLYIPYETTDLLIGGNFESGDFSGWTANNGDGSVADEGTIVNSGSHAAKLTTGASADTYIKQTFNVTENVGYSVQYYVRHDSEYYRVVDVTHGTDIIAKKAGGNWGDTYTQKTISFKAPAGCAQVDVYFYSPITNTHYIYLDDVHTYEMTGPTFQAWKAKLTSFVTEIATRYKGKVTKYEAWNEPNLTYFWKPLPDINQYMEVYTAIADAIHAVDPTAQVAAQIAALQGASNEPRGDDFLQAFYDNDIDPDVVSYHAYTYSQTDAPTVTNAYNNFSDIAAIRAVMTNNGKSAKKMWITEFGWPTDKVTEAQQASYLNTALGMLRDTYSSYVDVATIYELQEGDKHGVFNNNGTEKQAVATIYKFLRPNFNWKGTVYNFEDWQANSSQDAHSVSSDPLFVNADSSDFNLQSTSPALNVGANLSLPTDFIGTSVPQGSAPDMGAYESIITSTPTPTPTPTATPTTNDSSTSSNNSPPQTSSPSTPSCSDTTPTRIPDLFQADMTSTTAKLYLTTLNSNVTGYAISYGLYPDDERFGTTISYNGFRWIIDTTIGYLSSNTTYYFKVKALNGCTAGGWSKILKTTTTSYPTLIRSNYLNFYPTFKNLAASFVSRSVTNKVAQPPTIPPKIQINTPVPEPIVKPTVRPITNTYPAPPTSLKHCFWFICF